MVECVISLSLYFSRLHPKNMVADQSKIADGGHSYVAFMTANLLAHAPHLFSCGIARSSAYNRTLTPFGFQPSVALLASGDVLALLLFSAIMSFSNGILVFSIDTLHTTQRLEVQECVENSQV